MNIKTNSNNVQKGDTFIALRGINNDGHLYINEAIKKGANRVICEEGNYDIETIIVSDTRKYLIDYLQNNYCDYIKDMCLIGITGTNGKTTSAYLIYQALNKNNIKCAYIGTIGFYMNKKIKDLNNTTPDILDIYEMLLLCRENNYNYVVMEVSSQSLSMNRLDTILFDYAIFTNLTPEHLDYHKDMEQYALAKQKLFNKLKTNGKTIVNIDDQYKNYFFSDTSITYGINKSDYQIIDYSLEINKTVFKINDELFETKLIGKYNIYNLLVCIIILKEFNLDTKVISFLNAPSGRMEKIIYNNNIVIVDYAHTPDAVEKVISNIKTLNVNNIYVIIGCGGNRDKSKRSTIGNITTLLATKVIFTDDNPRNENPKQILEDITKDLTQKNYMIIQNRCKAIKKGIQLLHNNDILLVLGKGHENYQIIKNKKNYFSDKEEILKIIRR